MSMRRDTEFRWQAQSGVSKHTLSLLLCVAGLVTGYMFVTSGRHPVTEEPVSETARATAPPRGGRAIEEHSGVATAAPLPVQLLNPSSVSRLEELASDEPSTVAIKAAPAARTVTAATEREEPAPRRPETRQRRTSSYATLREALLRNVR